MALRLPRQWSVFVMQKSWKFFVFAFLMVLASSLPAAAQVEVSGGYNFLRDLSESAGDDEKNFPKGWYGDLAVGGKVAVVGQITGNYKTFEDSVPADLELRVHTFMGGARVGGSGRGAAPFVQVLGGVARTTVASLGNEASESDGALQVGAGVNLLSAGGIGLRLGADYIRVFTEGEGTN